MPKSCLSVAIIIALSISGTAQSQLTSIVFHDGTNESTLAIGSQYFACERPRLNDLGEVVWTQQLSTGGNFAVYSNLRGAIVSGVVARDPDISNSGEIIWRFGDGGPGANGIVSSVRGVIYEGTGHDPYLDTQRINNHGEIFASIGGGGKTIWSNLRGELPTVGYFARQTSVNDAGEVVYHSYDILTSSASIRSTVRGEIASSDGPHLGRPQINNIGEIVWAKSTPTGGEIWSDLRGKIANGGYPSINDLGEVVWSHTDGHDNEIFSSVRGQLTFNDVDDIEPQINNRGEVAWLRYGIVPEPASASLVVAGLLISSVSRLRWRFDIAKR